MNQYEAVKEQNQKQFNSFPLGFAFNREQLKEGMQRLGVENEADLIGIGGGGFIRATDRAAFLALLEETQERIQKEIDNDQDGSGFIKEMFFTELANHEYCISGNLGEVLEACGMTLQELEASPKLKNGLQLALKEYETAGFE